MARRVGCSGSVAAMLAAMLVAMLAALLQAGVAASPGQPPLHAAAGSGPTTMPAAPTTTAAVEAMHQRQRQLCQPLVVAAVRAECLRQADRSRAQALARLAPAAPGPPAAPPRQRLFSP